MRWTWCVRERVRETGRESDHTTATHSLARSLGQVNPASISTGFEDVGGLEDTKAALRELVIEPFLRPELFAGSSLLRPVKGVLLYGPPGTGKTMLARAVARESGAVFVNVKLSTLQSKWFGDAQRLVHAVFTLAWKLAPSIIFIDEVDALLSTRKAHDQEPVNSMKTEFMTMWDGMATRADAPVTVLAATNRPRDVDEAILRRLPRSFEVRPSLPPPRRPSLPTLARSHPRSRHAQVPLPGLPERAGILRTILRNERSAKGFDLSTEPGSPLHRIAGRTPGFSGSDLRELCRQAAYCAVREMIRDGGAAPRRLRERDFVDSIATSAPTRDAARSYLQRQHGRGGSGGGGGVDVASLIEVLSGLQQRARAEEEEDDDEGEDVDGLY